MTSFKRQYLFLGLLILAGLLVALSTLLGVDQRIGWIAAGFTIGVQVAIHMLRSAELRFARTLKELNAEAGDGRPTISVEINDAKLAAQAPITKPVASSPNFASKSPQPTVGNVVQLSPVSTADNSSAASRANAGSARCACACGCELSSNGGFEGLCSNCRSSRLQEVMACECDYTSSASCSCGVVKHWPAGAQSDLVATG